MRSFFALVLILSSLPAFSSTEKICFGSKFNPSTQGEVVKIWIDPKKIKFKVIKEVGYASSLESLAYRPSTIPVVKGKDGKNYLSFSWTGENEQSVLLVDSGLMSKGQTGLFKIRHTEEGEFDQLVYLCRDQGL